MSRGIRIKKEQQAQFVQAYKGAIAALLEAEAAGKTARRMMTVLWRPVVQAARHTFGYSKKTIDTDIVRTLRSAYWSCYGKQGG